MVQENRESQQRFYAILKKVTPVLALGVAYLVFCRLTGWGIPCIFQLITGWYCPGCGLSRMCIALSGLDIYAAARANIFALCLLPLGGGWLVYRAVKYVRTGSWEEPVAITVCYDVLVVLAILFGVLRNLEAFAVLAPH